MTLIFDVSVKNFNDYFRKCTAKIVGLVLNFHSPPEGGEYVIASVCYLANYHSPSILVRIVCLFVCWFVCLYVCPGRLLSATLRPHFSCNCHEISSTPLQLLDLGSINFSRS